MAINTYNPSAERREAKRYDAQEGAKESRFGPNYKWIVLSNTTIGALMFAIDSSIVLISLPEIFGGLGVNPLVPSNIILLLWMLLGYFIITSACVVTIGRLADMYGRVKLYNIGFVIFAITSVLIYVSSYFVHGVPGALSIIVLRLFQALGGSFLFANSAALITDAFPHNERGMALGINGIAFSGGSIIGLLIGGVLAAVDWHLIFLISVPVGIAGAIWSYFALHELASIKKDKKIDIAGNAVFAAAMTILMISLTYTLIPFGSSPSGWSNPFVIFGIVLSVILFGAFVAIETKLPDPMFRLSLFKNKGFSMGNLTMFLAGVARWGLEFMIIIWLQGIWLPSRGVDFAQTPFLAAVYMLPLTIGFLLLGPISGKLSDKYGPRIIATAGMLLSFVGFILLSLLPTNFSVAPFAAITFLIGAAQGMFLSPNIASIMNSLPPEHRGAGSGMRSTIMNASMMFSIIIFFTLLVAGLSVTLPAHIYSGLVSQGIAPSQARAVSQLPPTAALFAAFLGYNPIKTIVPAQALSNLTSQQLQKIESPSFFPTLVSSSFMSGLRDVLWVAAAMSLVAAVVSALRDNKDIYTKDKGEQGPIIAH